MSEQFDPEAEARLLIDATHGLDCGRWAALTTAALAHAFNAGAEQMRERAAVAVETRPIGDPATALEAAAAAFLRGFMPVVSGYIRTLPTRTDSSQPAAAEAVPVGMRAASARPHRVPVCTCGTTGLRNQKHDAYFCPECSSWLEDVCSDLTCEFCSTRPPTPPLRHHRDPISSQPAGITADAPATPADEARSETNPNTETTR